MTKIIILTIVLFILTSCTASKSQMQELKIEKGATMAQIEEACKRSEVDFLYDDKTFLANSGAAKFDEINLEGIIGRYSILQRISKKEFRRLHVYIGSDKRVVAIVFHPENVP